MSRYSASINLYKNKPIGKSNFQHYKHVSNLSEKLRIFGNVRISYKYHFLIGSFFSLHDISLNDYIISKNKLLISTL